MSINKKPTFGVKPICLLSACLLIGLLVACADSGDSGEEPAETQTQKDSGAAQASGLQLDDAYVRQPAPGQPMLAAFVTFNNDTDKEFRLNHISSPRAGSIEVHRTTYQDGVMAMRAVKHLVVAPQSQVVFKPGGYHLMLSELDGEFNVGDRVPLTFEFEGGTVLDVEAEVRPIH